MSDVERESNEETTWYLLGARSLGDGTLYYDNNGYVIEYARDYRKNYSTLEEARRSPIELGIQTTSVFPNDKKGVYVVQIPYHSLKLFVRLIGTNHPLKLSSKIEELHMLGLI